jgi:hypothetical protein
MPDRTEPDLSDASPEEVFLNRLVKGRIDPRRGVSLWLGRVRFGAICGLWAGLAVRTPLIGGCLMIPYSVDFGHGLLLVSAVVLLVCWLMPRGIRRRTLRLCNEHNYFLCPWCRYVLTDLGDTGACPECGHGFARSVCEQLYRNAYAPGHPLQSDMPHRERPLWSDAIRMRRELSKCDSR